MNKIIKAMLLISIPIMVLAQINWTKHTIDTNFEGPRAVFTIDMDDDTDIDVLGVAYLADDIAWWSNNGIGGFTKHNIHTDYDGVNTVYASDLDKDGDIDVLSGAQNVDHLVWWENNGSQLFTAHILGGDFPSPSIQQTFDMDGDNDIDVLGNSYSTDSICWFENDGNENFTKHVVSVTLDGPISACATDIDEDGDVDIAASAWVANSVAWFENDGSQNFIGHIIVNDIIQANSVNATDLDNDGDIDIICASSTGDRVIWLENDGNENFTKNIIPCNIEQPKTIYLMDLDNDGDIDIVSGEYASSGGMVWLENDGSQNFTKYIIDAEFGGVWSTSVADFDNDGDQDVLASGYYADDIDWWESDFMKKDVSVISIDIPSVLHKDTTFYPVSTIANVSTADALLSFDVTCEIDEYTSTYTITDLPKDDSIQITFDDLFTCSAGEHTVTVFTKLINDDDRTNDTLTTIVEGIDYYDVGTISIDIPTTVPEDTTINPHATISNMGIFSEIFNVTCKINPGGYTSTMLIGIDPTENVQMTFPDEFTFESGSYTVTVYTRLATDENPTNDTLETVIEAQDITVDVATVQIDIPDTISLGESITPHAIIANYGLATEIFNVTCTVEPGSYLSIAVVNIEPSDSIQVTFPDDIQFEGLGSYTVTVFTSLPGDENPANDTLEKIIVSHDPGVAEENGVLPNTFYFGLKDNPIKGKALFNLSMPHSGSITLKIYDASGRLIKDFSDHKQAGYHHVSWKAETQGVYFYTFESANYRKSGKLVVVK
jgi:hypothetical protein